MIPPMLISGVVLSPHQTGSGAIHVFPSPLSRAN